MLELWISKAMQDKIQLSGDAIREKWQDFAKLMGVKENEWIKFSGGWLDTVKKRTGLKEFKRHGEAASADPQSIEEERT
jgi:hypothetical protein